MLHKYCNGLYAYDFARLYLLKKYDRDWNLNRYFSITKSFDIFKA